MRKVFFSAMPNFEIEKISKAEYKAPEGSRIKSCGEITYPVVMAMESMIEDKDNEEYLVVTVSPKGEDATRHIAALDKELKERGFKHSIESIELEQYAGDSDQAEQAMKEMISKVRKDDDIYVNIEFGPKPVLLAMLFGILIIDNSLKDVNVEGIYYGEKKFGKRGDADDFVFADVSYLYYIGKLAGDMTATDEKSVLNNVEMLLKLGE